MRNVEQQIEVGRVLARGLSSETDNVQRPVHYTASSIECIDAIEAAIDGLPPREAFLVGQIIKYVWRYRRKNGIEDLEKAAWYLRRLSAAVETSNE